MLANVKPKQTSAASRGFYSDCTAFLLTYYALLPNLIFLVFLVDRLVRLVTLVIIITCLLPALISYDNSSSFFNRLMLRCDHNCSYIIIFCLIIIILLLV